jgi:phage/plasmid-associated DNA primase
MGDAGRDQLRDNTSSSNHSDDRQIQESYSNDRQHRNVQHNNDAEDLEEIEWQNRTIYRSDDNRQHRQSLGQQKLVQNALRSEKYESDAKALERNPLNRQIVTIKKQLAYKVIDFYNEKKTILNDLTSAYVRRYKPVYELHWDDSIGRKICSMLYSFNFGSEYSVLEESCLLVGLILLDSSLIYQTTHSGRLAIKGIVQGQDFQRSTT